MDWRRLPLVDSRRGCSLACSSDGADYAGCRSCRSRCWTSRCVAAREPRDDRPLGCRSHNRVACFVGATGRDACPARYNRRKRHRSSRSVTVSRSGRSFSCHPRMRASAREGWTRERPRIWAQTDGELLVRLWKIGFTNLLVKCKFVRLMFGVTGGQRKFNEQKLSENYSIRFSLKVK